MLGCGWFKGVRCIYMEGINVSDISAMILNEKREKEGKCGHV